MVCVSIFHGQLRVRQKNNLIQISNRCSNKINYAVHSKWNIRRLCYKIKSKCNPTWMFFTLKCHINEEYN